MLRNCYAIYAHFAHAQGESGREWNNQILLADHHGVTLYLSLDIAY